MASVIVSFSDFASIYFFLFFVFQYPLLPAGLVRDVKGESVPKANAEEGALEEEGEMQDSMDGRLQTDEAVPTSNEAATYLQWKEVLEKAWEEHENSYKAKLAEAEKKWQEEQKKIREEHEQVLADLRRLDEQMRSLRGVEVEKYGGVPTRLKEQVNFDGPRQFDRQQQGRQVQESKGRQVGRPVENTEALDQWQALRKVLEEAVTSPEEEQLPKADRADVEDKRVKASNRIDESLAEQERRQLAEQERLEKLEKEKLEAAREAWQNLQRAAWASEKREQEEAIAQFNEKRRQEEEVSHGLA